MTTNANSDAGSGTGGDSGGSSGAGDTGGNGAGGEQGGQQSREDRRWSELTSKLDAKDATIKELSDKVEGYESKLREQADNSDTAKGELSKVVERLQADNKALQEKLETANGTIAGFEVDEFERSVLDQIQKDASANPRLVRGAYREMLASRKLDRKPKDAKDAVSLAAERKKVLAEDFPELFESRDQARGGTPPGQGSGRGGRGKLTL